MLTTGSGKEIVITHNTDNSYLQMMERPNQGTGPWNEQIITSDYLIWNRSVIGGSNNQSIHMIAITASTNFGGTPFNGVDGALVYYRSQDEGATWDIQKIRYMDLINF